MWLYLILFLILLTCVHYKKTFWYPKLFPPGPQIPLPLIGDAYVLGKDAINGFQALRAKYGDVIGLYLGNMRSVVIMCPETMVEAMAMDELSARANFGEDLGRVQGAPSR